MATEPAAPLPFDGSPREWSAHPIVDSHRWLGFDLFGAFQFLQLMQLMCFLSGVFVWPSLKRKGAKVFLLDRVVRLGLPFVFGVCVLSPVTHFPVYLVGAVDPSWTAFWSHWIALPFWPAGPLWFLWFVLVLNTAAAALYQFVPRSGRLLEGIAAYAGDHPERFFIGLVVVSALAYLPMAAVFAPWYWIEVGPFAFQPAIAPQYTVYFFAGLAVGTLGIDRGFLAADAMLAQRWAPWLVGALSAFALWVAAAGLIESGYDTVILHLVRELSFVLFAASACLGSIAIFLRFATVRRPLLGAISDNAYGIYLFHYLFVIWTQYALLALDLPAIVKGLLVLAITLTLSWAVAAVISGLPAGARLMRGERRTSMAAPSSTERPQAEVQAEATE
jgi:hypothetical protein